MVLEAIGSICAVGIRTKLPKDDETGGVHAV